MDNSKLLVGDNLPIYKKYYPDIEYWYDYDSNNNLIHYKVSSGYECWYEYNSNGYLIIFKNSEGYQELFEVDSKGYLVSTKTIVESDDYEYDDRSDEDDEEYYLDPIHFKYLNGFEIFFN